jgi:hypothetical protein
MMTLLVGFVCLTLVVVVAGADAGAGADWVMLHDIMADPNIKAALIGILLALGGLLIAMFRRLTTKLSQVQHVAVIAVEEVKEAKNEIVTLKVEVNHRLTQLLAITAQAAHAEGIMQATRDNAAAALLLAAKAAGQEPPIPIEIAPLTPVVQEMVTQAEISRMKVEKVEEAEAQRVVDKAQQEQPPKAVP